MAAPGAGTVLYARVLSAMAPPEIDIAATETASIIDFFMILYSHSM